MLLASAKFNNSVLSAKLICIKSFAYKKMKKMKMMTKSGLERRKVVISGCEYRLKLYNSESSIQLFFLQKVVRQKDTHVTSFCMHFEKVGRGLQREAFRR